MILALQDQLSRLEQDLKAIEKRQRQKDAPDIHNGSFREETQDDRKKPLLEARHLLREYSDLVLQHSQLKSHPPVPKKDISSLENWFSSSGNAILEAETEYIKRPSDLFSVVPKIQKSAPGPAGALAPLPSAETMATEERRQYNAHGQ